MTELAERRQRIAIAHDEFLSSGRSRTEPVPDVEAERDLIVKALRDEGGNRVRAAEVLGIARSSLYRKLKSHGITAV